MHATVSAQHSSVAWYYMFSAHISVGSSSSQHQQISRQASNSQRRPSPRRPALTWSKQLSTIVTGFQLFALFLDIFLERSIA